MKILRVFLLFVLMLLVFLFGYMYPVKSSEPITSLILTASTFLFGVFMAFSISDRHRRIDDIRTNDSVERAGIQELFELAKLFSKGFQKKMVNLMDKYLMATLDYVIWDYYKTEEEFKNIVEFSQSVKVKTKKQEIAFDRILNILDSMGSARKKTISLIDDRLSKFEWLVFIILSGTIITSLLLANTGTMVSVIIVSVVTLGVGLLLLFLYILDMLEWKEEDRIFEPYQRTFEALGLMRYYTDDMVIDNRAKKYKGKTYRLTTFLEPYPSIKKKTKIVKG